MSRLSLLVLWVTTDCNLRCRYCYANGGDRAEYMGWRVAKRALDIMIGRFSRFKIQFAGGEPLLNLNLVEQVVRYTYDWGVRYQLQTNATLIDGAMAQTIRSLGIDVGVSLDGLPAVNDSLRPFADERGSTAATVAGLEHLRASGIHVGLTCVLSAENAAGLPGLVALAGYLGNVEGIALDVLRPTGRAKEGGVAQATPALAAVYVSEALRHADELIAMGGRRVRFREVERMRHVISRRASQPYRCYFDAGQLLMVQPDGEAYPCPSLVSFPEFSLGNVLEPTFTDRLEANLQKCRQLIIPPHRCLGCDKRWLCAGPCPAQTYAQRLTGEMKPTECHIKRAFVSYIERKETINHASANQIGLSV